MDLLAPPRRAPRKHEDSSALPVVIGAAPREGFAELEALITAQKTTLSRTIRTAGAILFRGFGVTEPRQLSALLEAAGGRSMSYVAGDSPRDNLGGDVYTATEAPGAIRIPLHNEMSYLDEFPRHLWFACEQPAEEGGETILGDGRKILHALDRSVVDRFARSGVRYQCAFRGPRGMLAVLDRAFRASKSWMEAFETDDAREAEERCRRIATRTEWAPNGSLVFQTRGPATIEHPDTGDAAWFNQAHVFVLSPRHLGSLRWALASALFRDVATRPHHATYGDGQAIDASTLEHVHDILDAHTRPVRWERGDVLWVDNIACMHGREPFVGRRRVIVALAA